MKDKSFHEAEFVALLTEHQSCLRYYILSLMPGDSSAPDVVQEANMVIWNKRSDFELGTNFKAWVFSIARYSVQGHRHKRRKDSKMVFGEELEDLFAEEMPEEADLFEDQQLALRHCLQKLKDADRDLILHRYYQKSPLKDYSEQIGRSLGSLKVTLFRIRNRLKNCVMAQIAHG